jgi:hypothetical protein
MSFYSKFRFSTQTFRRHRFLVDAGKLEAGL